MNKFEIEKINENTYFLNMIQKQDEFMMSNGLSFTKDELYELYLKLRNIFSN